ncbi:GNAT family N-acetyltransferase [Sphingomonas kaistensis]|uniref:GNAT family N-acetyltransferase n=1 Tax=Sphingomonas kaistensis TaxID=298708 RepID=A0ABZ2FX23_9SPHN
MTDTAIAGAGTAAAREGWRPSELESRRFGVTFGILDTAGGEHDWRKAVASADQAGVHVLSARVDGNEIRHIQELEALGFRLVDTLVYHRHLLPAPTSSMRGAESEAADVRFLDRHDAEACSTIARAAFDKYLGRYHADPRLSDTAATDAYADWAGRLLSEPDDGRLALGAIEAGRLTGFIVGGRPDPQTSEIILNAVDPADQGRGTYRRLLDAYVSHASTRGAERVITSTQLRNVRVQSIWADAGFRLYRSVSTLHRWAD